MKPSQVLRLSSKFYKRTQLVLYRKGKNGKCEVCALGALALVGHPERFYVNNDRIYDAQTHDLAKWEDILRAYDIPEKKIHKLMWDIIDRNDGIFISDKGLSFAHMARFLERKGL